MRLATSEWLREHGGSFVFDPHDDSWFAPDDWGCAEGWRRWFRIPKNHEIQLELHDSPGPDRLLCAIDDYDGGMRCVTSSGKIVPEDLTAALREWAEENGSMVYVEVYTRPASPIPKKENRVYVYDPWRV